MKRCILVLILFAVLGSFASDPFGPAYKRNQLFYIDLSGGTLFPLLDNYQYLDWNPTFNIIYNESVSIRYQFREKYSFSTQLNYLHHDVKFSQVDLTVLKSNYLSLYVPAEVEFKLAKNKFLVSPMICLFAGPYVIRNFGSSIYNDRIMLVRSSDVLKWNYGLESGIGLRLPMFSTSMRSNFTIKAAYYHGGKLPDNVESYIGESADLKSAFMALSSLRLNQGVKISICWEFFLKELDVTTFTAGGNGKTSYKRMVLK